MGSSCNSSAKSSIHITAPGSHRDSMYVSNSSAPDRHVVGLNPRPSTGKHKHIAGSEERLVQYS